ncbi:type III-B CRISPR module-associated protein Cmr3 [Pyrococcus kukulkanii]|uniref:type III-B CRISPR module-associated protein Cmr3 n=1 Tax=Pyrococcus kukulkanii TaxID=1609559 RepID=UPI0035689808
MVMEILPNDVLMFRESREFSAGEYHVAVTREPLPHTIAGAIMANLYLKGGVDLINYNSDLKRWKPGFSILGVFFAKGGKPLFPLPKDLVAIDNGVVYPLKPREVFGRVIVVAGSEGNETLRFKPAGGFLTLDDLNNYLTGKGGPFTPVPSGDVYVLEERIGIGIDRDRRVVVEGLLYRTVNLRVREGVSLKVYFERGEDKVKEIIGEKGMLRLGGESKFATYRFNGDEFPVRLNDEKSSLIRLYFATPLIPRGGIEGVLNELKIEGRILKVFTGRKIAVTGWDMKAKMPKETLYAYPAGTVVWVEADGPVEIGEPLKAGLMKEFGYGLVLPGVMG